MRPIFREIQVLMSFTLTLLSRRFRRCSKITSPEFKRGSWCNARPMNTPTHELHRIKSLLRQSTPIRAIRNRHVLN